jgi:hypothetical protein
MPSLVRRKLKTPEDTSKVHVVNICLLHPPPPLPQPHPQKKMNDLDPQELYELLGKKNPNENRMTPEEWDTALGNVKDLLGLGRSIGNRELTTDDLGDRNSPKGFAHEWCMIFPWFHQENARFRETLSDGLSPDELIQAMNFFFRTNFSAPENRELRERLERRFKEMSIPPLHRCLSSIILLYREFHPPVAAALPGLPFPPLPAALVTAPPLAAPPPPKVAGKRPASPDPIALATHQAICDSRRAIVDYQYMLRLDPDPFITTLYLQLIDEAKAAILSLEADLARAEI